MEGSEIFTSRDAGDGEGAFTVLGLFCESIRCSVTSKRHRDG